MYWWNKHASITQNLVLKVFTCCKESTDNQITGLALPISFNSIYFSWKQLALFIFLRDCLTDLPFLTAVFFRRWRCSAGCRGPFTPWTVGSELSLGSGAWKFCLLPLTVFSHSFWQQRYSSIDDSENNVEIPVSDLKLT